MAKYRHYYTEENIAYIRRLAEEGKNNTEIMVMFNEKYNARVGYKAMSTLRKRYGIFLKDNGKFKRGCTAWNKGMKGLNLGGEKGWFKKGSMPSNHRPVGSTRISRDGYIEFKVADPQRWEAWHRKLWEIVNGPIPPGHVVIFGDGNPMNCALDNLLCISRNQLLQLNRWGLIKDDVELTKIGLQIVDVYKIITEHKKGSDLSG